MNIAVVGAGAGGTNIIRTLSQVESIKITEVVEVNDNAPGVVLAKEKGIRHLKELDKIDTNNLDLIIEVTGNNAVAGKLYELYNDKCKIIDSKSVRLLLMLVERDVEMLERLNKQITALHEVSNALVKSATNSNRYIQDSEKIVQDVNKIAKQTKILGINANIEAARSGEHGKGFSVVANEVQNLADNSEMFAQEINRLLSMLSEELGKIDEQVKYLNKMSDINAESHVK